MERYSKVKRGLIESPRLDAFLDALLVVCREHGFSIDADCDDIVVYDYHVRRNADLREASWAGVSVEPALVYGGQPTQVQYVCSSCSKKALSFPLFEGFRTDDDLGNPPRFPHRLPEGWTLDEERSERCTDCRRSDPRYVFEAAWEPFPEVDPAEVVSEVRES